MSGKSTAERASTGAENGDDWFRVEVTDRDGQVVAIETEMLAGRDIGEREDATIRRAIRHLAGFVGADDVDAPPPAGKADDETRPHAFSWDEEGGADCSVCGEGMFNAIHAERNESTGTQCAEPSTVSPPIAGAASPVDPILSLLRELEELERQATPGEWLAFYKHKYNEWHVSVPSEGGMKLALFSDGIPTEKNRAHADAQLIARLRNAFPRLAEELRGALRRVGEVERDRDFHSERAAHAILAVGREKKAHVEWLEMHGKEVERALKRALAAESARDECVSRLQAAINEAIRSGEGLQRELERERADAERYRWLREHSLFLDDGSGALWFHVNNKAHEPMQNSLDRAIDAAITAAKPAGAEGKED